MINNDPALLWPKYPVLNSSVQLFYGDGVIIYGGTQGAFKVNGKESYYICQEVTNVLFENEKQKESNRKIIDILNQKNQGNKLIYFYNLLYQNGCLSFIYNNKEEQYWGYLNSYVKNFSSPSDIYEYRQNTSIKLNILQEYAQKKLYDFFKNNEIKVTNNNYKWNLVELVEEQDIYELDLKVKNIILFNTTEGLIIGPIVSRDAISIDSAVKLYRKIKISNKKLNESDISLISLCVYKLILKLSEYHLDRSFILSKKGHTEYKLLYDNIDISDKNLIKQYELKVGFPASQYANKKSHLTHYQTKNISYSKYNFENPFWKPILGEYPPNLMLLIKALSDFKDSNPRKKYAPTGGNLNSNMIFYMNYVEDHFEGTGIYFYNNIERIFYKVTDKVYKDNNSQIYDGILLLGSNIDVISKKYGDFSFKVANLNMGVLLATIGLFSNSNYSEKLSVDLFHIYDEEDIKKTIGMHLVNIIFNIGIGVKIND